jgi:hypothetical protein
MFKTCKYRSTIEEYIKEFTVDTQNMLLNKKQGKSIEFILLSEQQRGGGGAVLQTQKFSASPEENSSEGEK